MSFRRIVTRSAIAISLLIGVPSAGVAVYSHYEAQEASDAMGRMIDRMLKEQYDTPYKQYAQGLLASRSEQFTKHDRAEKFATRLAVGATLGVWALALILLWIAKPARVAKPADPEAI